MTGGTGRVQLLEPHSEHCSKEAMGVVGPGRPWSDMPIQRGGLHLHSRYLALLGSQLLQQEVGSAAWGLA